MFDSREYHLTQTEREKLFSEMVRCAEDLISLIEKEAPKDMLDRVARQLHDYRTAYAALVQHGKRLTGEE